MTGLEDRKILADHRHIAFVTVSKRSAILASPDTVGDHLSDEPPLLNGGLGYTGHGVTILGHGGRVSRHKHVGRLGDVHERADESTPGTICLCPEHFDDWRGADAGRPKHSGAGNLRAGRDHALVINLFDLYAGRDFNTELC